MVSAVFDLSVRVTVFTLAIGIATFPASADQDTCNAATTCRFGKQKFIVKTTVTPSPYHQSEKAAYSGYKVVVRNRTLIKRLYDEMETVTSESTSTVAYCSFKETVDLGALLDAGKGALVTLVAGETRLIGHRAVLAARSHVFAAMLCQDTQEASSGEIAMPDLEGSVLRQLLAYLYTLQIPQMPTIPLQLLAAADKFGLSALKAECEMQVAAQLAMETAAAIAVLAIKHSSTSLIEAAITFIRAHLAEVMTTQGWADAVLQHPKYFIEMNRLLAEPPAETSPHNASSWSSPAAVDNQPTTDADNSHGKTTVAAAPDSQPSTEAESQPRSGTPTTAMPLSPPHHTLQPNDDAVSRLRSLSRRQMGQRLIQAAKEGAVGQLEVLLEADADTEAKDDLRRTALHHAAERGHLEAVKSLLGAGAEEDPRDRSQYTPLILAAAHGHLAVVRLLLAYNADPNAITVGKWTSLHFAAHGGHTEVVAALLHAGADKRVSDNRERTPLDLARSNNRQQVMQLLTRS